MPSFVVGAYASLPQGREAQETYYDLLGEKHSRHIEISGSCDKIFPVCILSSLADTR